MALWAACRVELLSNDAPRFACDDCEVRLDETALVVSYFDDEGPVVLAAPNDGSGRFDLVARSRPRKATLTHDEAAGVLEGDWSEGGVAGTWRIVLRAE